MAKKKVSMGTLIAGATGGAGNPGVSASASNLTWSNGAWNLTQPSVTSVWQPMAQPATTITSTPPANTNANDKPSLKNLGIDLDAYDRLSDGQRDMVDRLLNKAFDIGPYTSSNEEVQRLALETLRIYGILVERDALARRKKIDNLFDDNLG